MRRFSLPLALSARLMSDRPQADPCLYSVPTWATAVTGRNADVLTLWQRLLSGQRIQVVHSIDGLGKSSLVSSFCECARSSGRFSCIQWFDGLGAADRVSEFVRNMKGRKESDVLFVLDDVESVASALESVPKRDNLYVLVTTSKLGDGAYPTMDVAPLGTAPSVSFFLDTNLSDTACEGLANAFQGVPLLMFLASRLIATGKAEVAAILGVVSAASNVEGALSVSMAVKGLVELALSTLSESQVSTLVVLAHLHTASLGEELVEFVAGRHGLAGGEFSAAADALGLVSFTGDDTCVRIHNSVRDVLRDRAGSVTLPMVATMLLSAWPQRMRGRKAQLAAELPWHNLALLAAFRNSGVALTECMLRSLDKGASYLALQEGTHLGLAAEQWEPVLEAAQCAPDLTKEAIRTARDLGRVLYVLGRHVEAERDLRCALTWTERLYGRAHPMFGLVLGSYSPYLEPSEACLSQLDEGIASLTSQDQAFAAEEMKMIKEMLGVLMLCKAQTLTDLGKEVPDTLRASIKGILEQ